MLRVNGLKKCYGKICPLKNINFYVEGGLKVIYGRNASGKTTLMEILAGMLPYTTGKIELTGMVSFMPQEPMLYEEYRIKDYETLLHYMSGNEKQYLKMISELEIDQHSHVYSLSYGMKKAVFMSIVLSVNADIYLLDEPFLGIDAQRRTVLLNFLQKISDKAIVLVTESEKILTPNWILKGGVLVEPEN